MPRYACSECGVPVVALTIDGETTFARGCDHDAGIDAFGKVTLHGQGGVAV